MKSRKTIGVLLNALYGSYEYMIWRNLSTISSQNNIDLITFPGGALQSTNSFEYQKNQIFKLVNSNYLDGIIVLSGTLSNYIPLIKFEAFIKSFLPIPIVSIGMEIKGIPSVLIDNESGMRKATEHLIEKHNKRDFVVVVGSKQSLESMTRYKTILETFEKYNINFDETRTYYGNYTRDDGKMAVNQFFDQNDYNIDAIIGTSDHMLMYTLDEIDKRNLDPNRKIGSVGFDNIKESLDREIPLTTVTQPFNRISNEAINLIQAQLNGDIVKFSTIVPVNLVIRESCGCSYLNRDNNIKGVPDSKSVNKKNLGTLFSESLFLNRNGLMFQPLDNNWPLILSQLYLDAVEKSCYGEFYDYIEALLQESFDNFADTYEWHSAISIFFNLVKEFKSDTYLTIWREITTLISSLGEKYHRKEDNYRENQSLGLYHVNQELIPTYNEKELKSIITRELPSLGIPRAFIILYQNEHQLSSVKLYFDSKNKELNYANQTDFSSSQLLPDYLEDVLYNGVSKMVMPLFFKEQQLGYAIFEVGTDYGIVYETLATQISNAIKGVKTSEKLQRYNEELESKVFERTKQLEKINQQKSQFFMNLTHETKTPLTLIQNYMSRFMDNHIIDDDFLIIKENIDKLTRDMVNVLDLEKLNRGQLFYNNELLTPFSDLIIERQDLYSVTANKKDITMDFNIDPEIYINADPYAVDRIINNLIDNSIKYTQSGGHIKISLTENDEFTTFSVTDNGQGIHDSRIDKIFEPYYQLSNEKRNIQGIGMGLSIVQRIVKILDGEIFVDSKLHEGTTFRVVFKVCKEHKNLNIKKIDRFQQKKYIVKNKSDKTKKCPDVNTVILIVEDNDDMLSFLNESLSDLFTTYTAKNGNEALHVLQTIPLPDVIISDIMMDELDGYGLLERVKRDMRYNSIPFLLLSAKGSLEDKITGLNLGAIDFINKPFHIDELKVKISSILTNRKLIQQKETNCLEEKIKSIFDSYSSNITDKSKVNLIDSDYIKEKKLTSRETEILDLMLKGLFNKEISFNMSISISTVEYHITNIYKKLNLCSRNELISLEKQILAN